MNITEQLPKLGSDKPSGSVVINLYELKNFPYFSRPDYEAFKGRIYNTEPDCVSILLGCDARTLWDMIEIQRKRRKEIVLNNLPKSNYEFPDISYLGDEEYKAYNEVGHMLVEIKSILFDGRVMKSLDGYGPTANQSLTTENEECFFDPSIKYNSLSFLDFVQKNSFKIPPELKIHRNSDGLLEYVDSVAYGDLEQTFPGHPQGKPIHEDPLYIAVQVRKAVQNGTIRKTANRTLKQNIAKWVKENYGHIILSVEKQKQIVSLVNDGAGSGGKREKKN